MHTHRTVLLACVVSALAVMPAQIAGARDHAERDPYSIMKPEPWLAPEHRSPRGLRQQPGAARPPRTPPPSVDVAKPAPPTVLSNGRVVPNLPPVRQGIVPGGGRETFGDRAARCAHQMGVYGVPGNQRTVYMHSCTMR